MTPQQILMGMRHTASLSGADFAKLIDEEPSTWRFEGFRAAVNEMTKFNERQLNRVCGFVDEVTDSPPAGESVKEIYDAIQGLRDEAERNAVASTDRDAADAWERIGIALDNVVTNPQFRHDLGILRVK